jgi:photosystem II stability/assembly factor-like uncharacterized protein
VTRASQVLLIVVAVAVAGGVGASAARGANAGWTTHRASSGAPLLCVATTDLSHAWAVGPGPTIVTSTDGGATWAPETAPTTNDLYGVTFADAADGWAVGPAGTVIATTDGGAHWAAQSVPTTQALVGVASRGQLAWAVGTGGTIVATTDGGATWLAQSSPSSRDLFSVAFADASNGWAVGDHGTILATTDGGAVWTAQTSPTTGYLNGVACRGATRAWAVGERGVALATSDGGARWLVRRPAGAHAPDLYTVDFASRSHGWAVGLGGLILASIDYGKTWRAQRSPSDRFFTSVAFADVHHGFIAEITGAVLTSSTAGWSDTLAPTVTAAGVAGWHRRTVHVVLQAGDGQGSGVAALQYSLDHGQSWTTGAAFAVAAPADHSNDGSHAFLARATDNAGNVATRIFHARIDTRRPVAKALWVAEAVSGQPAALSCAVSDPRPGSPTATVTITVRTASGRAVKTLRFAGQPVGKRLICRFHCTLAVGQYRFFVSATDAAGNRVAGPASNRLEVLPRPAGAAGPRLP